MSRLEMVTLPVGGFARWLHGEGCINGWFVRQAVKKTEIFCNNLLCPSLYRESANRFTTQPQSQNLKVSPMITSSHSLFDSTLFGQPSVSSAPASTPAKTAPNSKASQTRRMSATLWRHTLTECEATHRHGIVVQALFGMLGILSIGSVAAAASQMHALLSGNCLHDAISAFVH